MIFLMLLLHRTLSRSNLWVPLVIKHVELVLILMRASLHMSRAIPLRTRGHLPFRVALVIIDDLNLKPSLGVSVLRVLPLGDTALSDLPLINIIGGSQLSRHFSVLASFARIRIKTIS